MVLAIFTPKHLLKKKKNPNSICPSLVTFKLARSFIRFRWFDGFFAGCSFSFYCEAWTEERAFFLFLLFSEKHQIFKPLFTLVGIPILFKPPPMVVGGPFNGTQGQRAHERFWLQRQQRFKTHCENDDFGWQEPSFLLFLTGVMSITHLKDSGLWESRLWMCGAVLRLFFSHTFLWNLSQEPKTWTFYWMKGPRPYGIKHETFASQENSGSIRQYFKKYFYQILLPFQTGEAL